MRAVNAGLKKIPRWMIVETLTGTFAAVQLSAYYHSILSVSNSSFHLQ